MRAAVVIPACNAENTIGATVRAAAAIEGVAQVIVVDDGSTDATARLAEEAGASAIRLARNRGKGAALNEGIRRLDPDTEAVVLLDADLGETAVEAAKLLRPLADAAADLAIAVLPSPPRSGGIGLVKRTARWGIRRLSGYDATAPLSGQRALTRQALDAVTPFASGFGVEVAMTVRAARAGLRIVEVPVAMTHRATGRDFAGFAHRGKQFVDVVRTIIALSTSGSAHKRRG
ncbi:MAG: glycosyltransferase family 2 protein [Anaerosomatales bacterium]|nr:glycosyltransferase family 2 protein [Anaerosomatales bacterium]